MFLSILFTVGVVAFVILFAARVYFKTSTRWCLSNTCLKGKIAIVTGSNSGIGYATALDFARRGAKVILACRNRLYAETAKSKIVAATDNKNVVVKFLDLESLHSVRTFCKDITESEDRLDILVNNAGVWGLSDYLTKDGLQVTWQVNHLAPFLLTHLLLDLLRKSPDSRIVVVASAYASMININVKDVNEREGAKFIFSKGNRLYSATKVANILFVRELARRLSNSPPIINAVDPGLVHTEIHKNIPSYIKFAADIVLNIILKSIEEGAQTSIQCALLRNHVTGMLFKECQKINMYKSCTNMFLAKEVWKECEKIVGLKEHEKIPDI